MQYSFLHNFYCFVFSFFLVFFSFSSSLSRRTGEKKNIVPCGTQFFRPSYSSPVHPSPLPTNVLFVYVYALLSAVCLVPLDGTDKMRRHLR